MAGVENGTDTLTSLLIAQLSLEDVSSIKASRKGKAQDATPLTDEEVAFKLFEEESLGLLRTLELARSIQNAVDDDSDLLQTLNLAEIGAEDDHQYALALSRGEALPEKTDAQNALESPTESVSDDEENETIVRVSPHALSSTAGPSTSNSTPVECVICGDRFRASQIFQAPCEDRYCTNCLRELVQACLRDESLFPLRCCQKPLPVDEFETKSIEFSTLPDQRIYCSNPSCSRFLGSSEQGAGTSRQWSSSSNINCVDCFSSTCKLCKQRSHPSENCAENTALIELKSLAEQERWQTCPRCKRIIELRFGCNHMTCVCRTEFCYLCAAPWKECDCPQWDEARLLDTAERRAERELGAQVRIQQPAAFQQLVQTRARNLRTTTTVIHIDGDIKRGEVIARMMWVLPSAVLEGTNDFGFLPVESMQTDTFADLQAVSYHGLCALHEKPDVRAEKRYESPMKFCLRG
ncbi:hypothetical protein D9757_010513 [Collybiopsis confluens]|uniref:RBR-type E3 ubiquitin transferase n=1 Tax=Collybiopsis confluens TaxID=2823264 RepID=A0A8H5LSW6_9AGAR|nr:hypothetical protein D9757_010513 [Collybiopsis confluens]